MKCIKQDHEISGAPAIEPPIDAISDLGLSDDWKKLLKNIFLPLTVFVLFVTAIFFVKYLFKQESDDSDNIISGAILKRVFIILSAGKEGVGKDSWKQWSGKPPACKAPENTTPEN